MTLEHARILECVERFVASARPAVLDPARQIIQAYAEAEEGVLFPMVAKLRPHTRAVLGDSSGDRAQQLTELEALVQTRTLRARKLAAAALADRIRGDAQRRIEQILPALSSQLPRLQYRAVAQAFIRRYDVVPAETAVRAEPAPRRRVA